MRGNSKGDLHRKLLSFVDRATLRLLLFRNFQENLFFIQGIGKISVSIRVIISRTLKGEIYEFINTHGCRHHRPVLRP